MELATERKLSCLFVFFSYGGHSGMPAEHPSCREFVTQIQSQTHNDPRIDRIEMKTYSDTPITMTRNKAIKDAREQGFDLVVFFDADQDFMLHADDPWYKPFFPVAFDAIYDHYDKGPLVIAAPYTGGANNGQNIFYFQWRNQGVMGDDTTFSLEQYTREEAALMSGLHPVAALPTGLIMFDLRIFDVLDDGRLSKEQALDLYKDGKITKAEALRSLSDGYFYYEWTDETASEKASTEDVTITRDISLIGEIKLGYNPLRVACDSWIGHVKPYTTGRPKIFSTEQVGNTLKRAVLNNISFRDRIVRVKNDRLLKLLEQRNGHASSVNG